MRDVTLNNGVDIPVLGFGVYQVPPDETERVVTDALKVGYRHIDTAAAYGNEEAVGRAIASSGIPRNELFITTKLWVQDAGEENTKRAFDASAQRLGLEQIDLFLIHQPFGDYFSEWRAMESLYRDGRIRAIGVSNFPEDRLLDLIINNEITPAVNQIETNPFRQNVNYHAALKAEGVQLESWAPFAEGKNNIFSNVALTSIGAQHGKSVAQVVVRWLIQRDIVVIPKSVRPDRMAQNFDVFDFELSEGDMTTIAELDTNETQFFDHRDPQWVRALSSRRI